MFAPRQRRKLAIRYNSPIRKAVDGCWVADFQLHAFSWDEVLVRACRPSFEVAVAAARLRCLARLQCAPIALFALLQVAGDEWRTMITSDLVWLRSVLGSAVESLPAPTVLPQPWLDVAAQFPGQWQQLVKRLMTQTIDAQQAQFQLSDRTIIGDFDLTSEEPSECPMCPRVFLFKRKPLEMHCRRAHGRRCPARFSCLDPFVLLVKVILSHVREPLRI